MYLSPPALSTTSAFNTNGGAALIRVVIWKPRSVEVVFVTFSNRTAGTDFEIDDGRRWIPGLQAAHFNCIQLRIHFQFLERLAHHGTGLEIAHLDATTACNAQSSSVALDNRLNTQKQIALRLSIHNLLSG